MKKPGLLLVSLLVLVMAVVLVRERRAKAELENTLRSIQTQMQELSAQVSALQQEPRKAAAPIATSTGNAEEGAGELARLREEVARLRNALGQLENANAALSNQISAAQGANVPFVYPDSTKRADYAFSGYTTPQSGLQSVLWSISQTDAKAFLASLTGTVAAAFAPQFQDLPEGVMPGGFKNGAMYKASGFRVLEETPVSEDEVRLKVFLEGSRVVIQPVFKKVGGEWKWARNEH